MRILFVIDSLGSGGSQRQMVNLALGLIDRGYDIRFFLYASGDHYAPFLQQVGIPILRHIKKSRYSLWVFWALRQHIKANQYDLVLSYMTIPSFYALVASRLIKNAPPVVISERSYDSGGLSWREAVARRLYRFASHLVVNSKHQCVNLRNKYPYLENRITTIYNGLDLKVFSSVEQEPPDQPFRLLALSSVAPHKNVLCLVRALGILAQKYNMFPQVSWAGRHFDETQADYFNYAKQVRQEIETLGVSEQWHWLNERTDVVNLLHQHHALVHPSYREGLPNVVCEALACGRPVLLSNTLEHPLLVEHQVSGFLFDWRDPSDLAKWICVLFKLTRQERHEMGVKGREFAERNLSIGRLVNNYIALFETLVK